MSKRKTSSPRGGGGRPRQPRRARPAGGATPSRHAPATYWLFGAHAGLAALANPRRVRHRLLLTEEAERRHAAAIEAAQRAAGDTRPPTAERGAREDFARLLGPEAVHQGLALLTEPLEQPSLSDVLRSLTGARDRSVILALDQVTDPHNVGAVLRSAAAFGARAVLAPRHHAAPETGVLGKAASGALDHIPYLQAGNLVQALAEAKQAGFWVLGLAGDAETALPAVDLGPLVVIVLGSEGAGLRRLTREACDVMVRLPTRGAIADLNVSNAAAVALYELLGRQG